MKQGYSKLDFRKAQTEKALKLSLTKTVNTSYEILSLAKIRHEIQLMYILL